MNGNQFQTSTQSVKKTNPIWDIMAIIIGLLILFSYIFAYINDEIQIEDLTDKNNLYICPGVTLNDYYINNGCIEGNITWNNSFICDKGMFVNVTFYDENKAILARYADTSPQLLENETWVFSIAIPNGTKYYIINAVNTNK